MLDSQNYEKKCDAIAWQKIMLVNETEALSALKLFATNACQPSLTKFKIQSKLIDNNIYDFFVLLVNITDLSVPQIEKIIPLLIESMGKKIFDLITVHFEKQSWSKDLDNSLIEKIIKHILLTNESFKNYIINCLEPITKIIYSNSITLTPLKLGDAEIFYYSEDNIDSLVPAFEKSIVNLLTIQNYPLEIQRIILNFSEKNSKDLLAYLIFNFINPVIFSYADNSNNENIKVWSYKIIVATLEALTSFERIENPKIHPYLLDLVSVNKEFTNHDVRNKVDAVITKKIDINLLNSHFEETKVIRGNNLKNSQHDFQQLTTENKKKLPSNSEIITNIGIFPDSKSKTSTSSTSLRSSTSMNSASISPTSSSHLTLPRSMPMPIAISLNEGNSKISMSTSVSPPVSSLNRMSTSTSSEKIVTSNDSSEPSRKRTKSMNSSHSSKHRTKERTQSMSSSHSPKTNSKEKIPSFNSNSIFNPPQTSTVNSTIQSQFQYSNK